MTSTRGPREAAAADCLALMQHRLRARSKKCAPATWLKTNSIASTGRVPLAIGTPCQKRRSIVLTAKLTFPPQKSRKHQNTPYTHEMSHGAQIFSAMARNFFHCLQPCKGNLLAGLWASLFSRTHLLDCLVDAETQALADVAVLTFCCHELHGGMQQGPVHW